MTTAAEFGKRRRAIGSRRVVLALGAYSRSDVDVSGRVSRRDAPRKSAAWGRDDTSPSSAAEFAAALPAPAPPWASERPPASSEAPVARGGRPPSSAPRLRPFEPRCRCHVGRTARSLSSTRILDVVEIAGGGLAGRASWSSLVALECAPAGGRRALWHGRRSDVVHAIERAYAPYARGICSCSSPAPGAKATAVDRRALRPRPRRRRQAASGSVREQDLARWRPRIRRDAWQGARPTPTRGGAPRRAAPEAFEAIADGVSVEASSSRRPVGKSAPRSGTTHVDGGRRRVPVSVGRRRRHFHGGGASRCVRQAAPPCPPSGCDGAPPGVTSSAPAPDARSPCYYVAQPPTSMDGTPKSTIRALALGTDGLARLRRRTGLVALVYNGWIGYRCAAEDAVPGGDLAPAAGRELLACVVRHAPASAGARRQAPLETAWRTAAQTDRQGRRGGGPSEA